VVVVVVVRRWRVCGADQTETRSVPAIRTLVRTQDAAATQDAGARTLQPSIRNAQAVTSAKIILFNRRRAASWDATSATR